MPDAGIDSEEKRKETPAEKGGDQGQGYAGELKERKINAKENQRNRVRAALMYHRTSTTKKKGRVSDTAGSSCTRKLLDEKETHPTVKGKQRLKRNICHEEFELREKLA